MKLEDSIYPLPIDQRNCFSCQNMIEDELQFLFDCDCYHDLQVIVRHLIQASSKYKCLSRRWQIDVIETEVQLRFLLSHSNTSYEGIYTLKRRCMRCLTVLENGSLCVVFRLLTWARWLLAGVNSALSNVEGASIPTSYRP